jgi:hypothetical protein
MKSWRKYIVLSISMILIAGVNIAPVQSCAGGSAEDFFYHRITFFQSDLAQDSLFKHYYFDASAYRTETAIDADIRSVKDDRNLKEWEDFLRAGPVREEIRKLVYKTSAAELESKLQQPSAAGHPLFGTPNRPALEYLIFAKHCEPYAVASESDWYDDFSELKKRRKPEAMRQLIASGLAGYERTDSTFLKLRYAYQVVRLANYAGFYDDCINYYDRLVPPVAKRSEIADWALRLKAGALRKTKKEAEALVQISLLFDQSPDLMDEAFVDFRIPPEPIWTKTLRLAGSRHRQATLWLLRGLTEKRFQPEILEQLYQLEPRSSRLEVMLVRYINRLELAYFESYLFFKPVSPKAAERKAAALKYINELKRFLRAADRQKVHDPALWDSAAAYLNTVTQNYREAEADLARAGSRRSKNRLLPGQIAILNALNQVAASPEITAPVEASCLKALTLPGPKQRHSNLPQIYDSFHTLLAQKYFDRNNFVKAYCSLARTGYMDTYLLDYYPSFHQLDELIAFITQRDKTPYEKLLTTGLKYGVDDLYSVKGTLLLRAGNIKAAHAAFSRISAPFWAGQKKNAEGWYEGLIRTSFEPNYYNPGTGLYRYPKQGFPVFTKLEFTRKVLELEAAAGKNPAKADRYYYQIANGFFHSPYWACNENLGENLLLSRGMGDSGDYLDYFFTGYPFDFDGTAAKIRQGLKNQLQRVGVRKMALRYYVKAMRATQNQEFAARCAFLAQACMTEFSHYRAFREAGKSQFYYFDLLRQEYKDTGYYKNVVKECATLNQYVNSKH